MWVSEALHFLSDFLIKLQQGVYTALDQVRLDNLTPREHLAKNKLAVF